ncbi:MAG: ATP-binding protein, partial [Candidatus Aminicenantaceae bacterium]
IDEVREALKDIISDDKRARDVVTRLRALVKKKESLSEPFDLNATIRETIRLLHSETLLRKASIKMDLAPELPVMRGDRIQIQQVVINLIMNSLDAVQDLPQDSRLIEVTSRTADEPGIRLTVNDSGPGIAPEVLDSIFEPFYTTKAQGTGLGLTVCRSIAATYGGRLQAENRSEGGASVSLWLPAAEGGGR